MSEPVYEISAKGRIEMRRLCAEALHVASHGIIDKGLWRRVTPAEVREMYYPRIKKLLAEARVQVDPNSPIAIRCNNCSRVSTISREVKTFHCHCSPWETQWVMKSRHLDLEFGTRVLDGGQTHG